MPKAVFTTKVDPAYDDLPEQRYHFPRTYLRAAREALKDWIVYYEPRRTSADLSSSGGRQSYFATAFLDDIQPDPHLRKPLLRLRQQLPGVRQAGTVPRR